jgi:hypothetical protein
MAATAASAPGQERLNHVLVSAKGLILGSRELAALGAGKSAIGKTARITLRPYRSSEVLAQDSAIVETLPRGDGLALSLQYKTPDLALGKEALVEIEVVIPAGAGKFLYYKEAMPTAGDLDLAIPFLIYETAVPVAWPALGSPTQVSGYASMGGAHPEEGEGSFQKNAKGEYRLDLDLVDAKTGKSYGQAVSWRKPGLARGQALAFAAPMGIPEGSTVAYTITARAGKGRSWAAAGQAEVRTTRLRYEGGFEPVLLLVSDELAPAGKVKGEAPGAKNQGADR